MMFRKIFLTSVICCVLIGWAWAQRPRKAVAPPTAPAPPARAAAPKFALLIGISNYQHKNLPEVRGAVNGADSMREVLIQRFGFPDENIQLLPNEKATADNIRAAFNEVLVENARRYPDGRFVFYFNGHGSQVPDDNCESGEADNEADNMDETIVPYDSRDDGNIHFDIRDDEMAAMMDTLDKETPHALYIFDSCHSGSANRGNGQIHEIPADRRPQPQAAARPCYSDNKLTNFAPASNRYVMIAACGEYELARDFEDNPNSALTHHLVQALYNANRNTTYRELMKGVEHEVSRLRDKSQHPLIVGDGERFVLDGAADEADAYLPIAPRSVRPAQLTLNAGAARGLLVGSYLAVYDQRATQLRGAASRKALGQITQVSKATAVVKLDEVRGPVTDADKVVVLTPQFRTARLPVKLLGDAAGLKTKLQALLGPQSLVTLDATTPKAATPKKVTRNDGGTLAFVRSGTEEEAFAGRPPLDTNLSRRKPTNQPGYYLTDLSGEPLFDAFFAAHDPQALTHLADALENWARQRNLQTLENTASPLRQAVALRGQETPETRVTLQFYQYPTGQRDAQGNYRNRQLSQKQAAMPDELRLGYGYHVELTNRSSEKLWVYLLDIGTDGAIQVMFPKTGTYPQEDYDCNGGLLEPGATLTSRSFRLTPPLGDEVFKVIVTAAPAPNICYLTQEKTESGRRGRGQTQTHPLDVLVAQTLKGVRPRSVSSATWDNWGTADFVTRIRP